jgi:hypothetical protein
VPVTSTAPDITSFDIQVDKLAPGFTGHNIKAIFKDLVTKKDKAVKGEFETTAEFEARLQRETQVPILGRLDRNGYFAFVINNSSGETFYDADSQVMTIAIALGSGSESIYKDSNKKALASHVEVKSEKYEGSNAYGAKATVTRNLGEYYDVAFQNYSRFGVSRYIDSRTRSEGYTEDAFAKDVIIVRIPMDVALAREVKSRLKILAIVNLVEPYTYEGSFYEKPTISRPDEYVIQYHFLNTELLQLWIFDESTGRIFAKQKPS